MRVSVKLEATGASLEEVTENARLQWAKFVGIPDAKLPHSSEMNIEVERVSTDKYTYKAVVHALTKVEHHDQ